MGVYIKGMEMPTSCWRCCLSQLYEKPRDMLACKITHEEVLRHKIDGNCPLVPVPPHGRLIEAESIMKFITDGLNSGEFGYDQIKVLTEIQYAPTIIPAEEGE